MSVIKNQPPLCSIYSPLWMTTHISDIPEVAERSKCSSVLILCCWICQLDWQSKRSPSGDYLLCSAKKNAHTVKIQQAQQYSHRCSALIFNHLFPCGGNVLGDSQVHASDTLAKSYWLSSSYDCELCRVSRSLAKKPFSDWMKSKWPCTFCLQCDVFDGVK